MVWGTAGSLAARLPSRHLLREALAAVAGTGSSCCRWLSGPHVLALSEVAMAPCQAPGLAHLLIGLPWLREEGTLGSAWG